MSTTAGTVHTSAMKQIQTNDVSAIIGNKYIAPSRVNHLKRMLLPIRVIVGSEIKSADPESKRHFSIIRYVWYLLHQLKCTPNRMRLTKTAINDVANRYTLNSRNYVSSECTLKSTNPYEALICYLWLNSVELNSYDAMNKVWLINHDTDWLQSIGKKLK